MRKVYSILLIILCLSAGFQQAIIIVHFKLNKKEITESFCINKDRPELQCQGNCYLKRKLQQTKNTEEAIAKNYHRVDMIPISLPELHVKDYSTQPSIAYAVYTNIIYTDPYRKTPTSPPREIGLVLS